MSSSVRSRDGTRIAFAVEGDGPALVLVHGTGDTRQRWAPVSGELRERFRLYAMDRRGHGESGDTAPYALEREFEDVAAVVAAAAADSPRGAPVHLLGHSFGGICALEAVARWDGVTRLVLYEPPLPIGDEPLGAARFHRKIGQLIEDGHLEAVWTTFLIDVVGVPPADLDRLRSSPSWAMHVATASLLPRELKARTEYRFDAGLLRSIRGPVLLVTGSESPAPLRAATQMVHGSLPGSTVVELDGQGHSAMSTAPALFARTLLEFLVPYIR